MLSCSPGRRSLVSFDVLSRSGPTRRGPRRAASTTAAFQAAAAALERRGWARDSRSGADRWEHGAQQRFVDHGDRRDQEGSCALFELAAMRTMGSDACPTAPLDARRVRSNVRLGTSSMTISKADSAIASGATEVSRAFRSTWEVPYRLARVSGDDLRSRLPLGTSSASRRVAGSIASSIVVSARPLRFCRTGPVACRCLGSRRPDDPTAAGCARRPSCLALRTGGSVAAARQAGPPRRDSARRARRTHPADRRCPQRLRVRRRRIGRELVRQGRGPRTGRGRIRAHGPGAPHPPFCRSALYVRMREGDAACWTEFRSGTRAPAPADGPPRAEPPAPSAG